MKRIGITGPTGAGKTTALRALASLGGEIIDCDTVYHSLLAGDPDLHHALIDRFGPEILDKGGQVDRKALGLLVFDHPDALDDLNHITHSAVLRAVDQRTAEAARLGRSAVGIDAIALIESGAAAGCCAVVGILAPSEVRVTRIMARDGISEAYARARVNAQKPDGFFRTHCTHILENTAQETPETFFTKAQTLFLSLLQTT